MAESKVGIVGYGADIPRGRISLIYSFFDCFVTGNPFFLWLPIL